MLTVTVEELEIKRLLGTGSFGKVFLVMHKNTKKHYAMKVLQKDLIMEMKQVRFYYAARPLLLIPVPRWSTRSMSATFSS